MIAYILIGIITLKFKSTTLRDVLKEECKFSKLKIEVKEQNVDDQ